MSESSKFTANQLKALRLATATPQQIAALATDLPLVHAFAAKSPGAMAVRVWAEPVYRNAVAQEKKLKALIATSTPAGTQLRGMLAYYLAQGPETAVPAEFEPANHPDAQAILQSQLKSVVDLKIAAQKALKATKGQGKKQVSPYAVAVIDMALRRARRPGQSDIAVSPDNGSNFSMIVSAVLGAALGESEKLDRKRWIVEYLKSPAAAHRHAREAADGEDRIADS